MTLRKVFDESWTRKHDMPGTAIIASEILYPKSLPPEDPLEELINLCKNRSPSEFFKAAGSHWALSEAAISDHAFIETHDPNNGFPAMSRTLYDVVPKCLNERLLSFLGRIKLEPFDKDHVTENEGTYLVHFETGKRIYQLYSELDLGDDANEESLARYIQKKFENSSYSGPWAFQTLGGAGGQTVFGALTTGTHGGDFKMPPIDDSVVALHLVADGGKHYWIEPKTPTINEHQLTDDDKLKALYGTDRYGGPENFEIIRDDNVFNSVLVSVGRFGIVYSIVMRAVRQYSLHEERRLTTWQEIKKLILDPKSELYSKSDDGSTRFPPIARFLQIAICVRLR